MTYKLTKLAKLLMIVCTIEMYQPCLAQEQQLKPNIQQWHKGSTKQLFFSYNGQYLVSFGDDNQAIITDVQKRKVMSVTNADDLLFVHPDSNYFYTRHELKDTAFSIKKRAFPLGNVVDSSIMPTKITALKLTLVKPFICSFNFVTCVFAVPYNKSYGENNTVIEFSKQGSLLDTITGISYHQINAMEYRQGDLYILTSNGLWKHGKGGTKKLFNQLTSEDYFANMVFREDTVVLLSNKQVSWVNTITGQLIQQAYVGNFFSKDQNDYTANIVSFHHPFVVDEMGAVWLTDTRIRTRSITNNQNPSYQLAKITANGITYPLKNSIKFFAEFESVEPEIAYSHSKQSFVFTSGAGVNKNLHFFHKLYGEIYASGQKNIPISQFKFTGTPGRILVQTGEDDNSSALFINLANGKLESIGTIDDRMSILDNASLPDFKKLSSSEKLYDPFSSQYINAPYWQKDGDNYITFSFRAPLLLDKTLSEGKLVLIKNSKQKELNLYGLQNELISKSAYALEKYQYDSISGLLLLQWISRMYGERLQHLVDTKTNTLVKRWLPGQWNKGNELFLLSANSYATDEGVFRVQDSSLITPFDNNYRGAKHFAITANKRYIIFSVDGYENPDKIIVWDNQLKKSYTIGLQFNINSIVGDPHSNLIYSLGRDGILKIWNPAEASFVADLIINCNPSYKSLSEIQPSYLLMNKEGYYMGENKYYSLLNLQYGSTDYPLSQIETSFQRPDKVLSGLGYAQRSLITGIEKIVNMRFKKASLRTSAGDIIIQKKALIPYFSNIDSITLAIQIPGNAASFKGLMAFVNGTALWPVPKPIVANSIQKVCIDLVDATNYVRLCLIDANGIETPGDYFYINAKPVDDGRLFVIGIGVSEYANKSNNLTYAAKDMQDFTNYFKLFNKSEKTAIFTAKNEHVTLHLVDSIRSFISSARSKDKIYLYYAGHGLLDTLSGNYYLSTYQWNFDNPSTTGYHIDSLNWVLANCKARKKLMIIDACNSGLIQDVVNTIDSTQSWEAADSNSPVKARGVPNNGKKQMAASVQYAFNYFGQSNGVDVLAASAGNELAFETKYLNNGLFTYSLLSTLKLGNSDFNKDGILSANEIQLNVRAMVEKLSKGKQRPSFRQSNIYQDIPIANVLNTYFGYFLDAARSNYVPMLKIYVEKEGLPIDQKDESGFTALLYACREGSLKAVKYLIENGASIAAKTKYASSLYLAAHNNHDDIVYYLLCHGAMPEELLAKYQIEEIFANSDPKITNAIKNFRQLRQQDSIILKLMDPLIKGDTTIAEMLYKADKLVNVDYWLRAEATNLLFTAVTFNQLASLQWLINKKVNINYTHKDINNITPLMMAVYFNKVTIAEILLKNGADKTAKDNNQKTALDYAKEFKLDMLIQLLQ